MAPRLKERYDAEIKQKAMDQFSIQNVLAAPRLQKIVVNMGCKGAVENKGLVESAARDLGTITRRAQPHDIGLKIRRRGKASKACGTRERNQFGAFVK